MSGKVVWGAVAGVVVAAVVVGMPYVRTTAFLLDLAGVDGGVRRWIPIAPVPVTTSDLDVPTRHGHVRVRLYEPESPAAPTVVVFPGVHGGGVDAPRLTQLCQRLGTSRLRVICAPLPELRNFVISGRSTDAIEDVTGWLSRQPTLSPGGRVTLVGVSFAGGLALVAAGRESLSDRLNAVVSIGGHGDLRRTLTFLTSGTLPDGTTRTPHDYPLAVVALTIVSSLVPPDQAARTDEVIRTFLEASLDDGNGFAHGIPVIARLKTEVESMPEPSRTLGRAVVNRDVGTVGRLVAPHIDELAANPALSPSMAPAPDAPVFLLHGVDDNVIPSTEATLLAEDVTDRGNAPVRVLLTPLLTHAHLATDAPLAERWALVDFWRNVRRAVER